MKKAFDWLVYSSRDPQKFAMTLKAGIPFVLLFIAEPSIDALALGNIVDQITHVLGLAAQLILGAMALYGAVRKVVPSLP